MRVEIICAVSIARDKSLVIIISHALSESNLFATAAACCLPILFKGISELPCAFPSLFHSVIPCLISPIAVKSHPPLLFSCTIFSSSLQLTHSIARNIP